MSEHSATLTHPSGWHFHPRMYLTQAWPDDGCPDPGSARALSPGDERVLRAMSYPTRVTPPGEGQRP